MPRGIRSRATVLLALQSLTSNEHANLKINGAVGGSYWSQTPEAEAPLVQRFREEVKDYYWRAQQRRCCYCSSELQNHKATYDLDHILDKDTHSRFMFELNNLAVACKPCNSHKSVKSILSAGWLAMVPTAVPSTSADYAIVHPQLDEWSDHLDFDAIGRIATKLNSNKGSTTIKICGINALNATRLADEFAVFAAQAENALRKYFNVTSRAWKRKYLSLLRGLAVENNLAAAVALVDALEAEYLAMGL